MRAWLVPLVAGKPAQQSALFQARVFQASLWRKLHRSPSEPRMQAMSFVNSQECKSHICNFMCNTYRKYEKRCANLLQSDDRHWILVCKELRAGQCWNAWRGVHLDAEPFLWRLRLTCRFAAQIRQNHVVLQRETPPRLFEIVTWSAYQLKQQKMQAVFEIHEHRVSFRRHELQCNGRCKRILVFRSFDLRARDMSRKICIGFCVRQMSNICS